MNEQQEQSGYDRYVKAMRAALSDPSDQKMLATMLKFQEAVISKINGHVSLSVFHGTSHAMWASLQTMLSPNGKHELGAAYMALAEYLDL
ncbi:hypothetical protein [Paraburkholderia phosphatilytica]|uniref:hypothetical protein n=1 Tax=Paraburkholderia phosphatilytica TaxID=2282883 RepID=UPI000E54413E|nr:hypothetical protein [Paraburkholderia phosphatilytica]